MAGISPERSTYRVAKRLVLFESNAQCFYHIETSQLICNANQLTNFYMG